MKKQNINDLSQFLNSDIPESLFHYTNLNGFQGIIEKSEIWMSNMYFLNDESEYKLGLNMLKNQLKNYKEGFSILESTKYFVEALEKAIEYIESKDAPFVLSLTTNNNLLSQWRGYTDNGIGVNIGFKNSFFVQNNLKIFKCIYDPKIQEEMISKIVTDSIFFFIGICNEQGIFKNDKKINLSEYDKAVTIAGNIFIDRAILACSLIKNSHFVEEDEWRVIYFNKDLEINFLNKNSHLKPFIKYKIKDLDSAINEINIGPNPAKTISEISIKSLLKKHKVQIEKVKNSEIPYRN